MKRLIGIKDVEEATGGFKRPEAGGYVCIITDVEDFPEKEYLSIEYDIAEGEFRNYYKELDEKRGFWGARFIKSYKDSALPFFKSFCTAVTESNNKFIFDGDEYCDEKTLFNKRIGLVLGEEEYQKQDGSLSTRLYVAQTLSVDRIRKGDYKVPELKRLKESENDGGSYMSMPTDDPMDELPFA